MNFNALVKSSTILHNKFPSLSQFNDIDNRAYLRNTHEKFIYKRSLV